MGLCGSKNPDQVFGGQVVWVVGASSGIGEGLARKFHEVGAKVVVSARRQEALEALANDLGDENVAVVPMDVADLEKAEENVNLAKAPFGRIDCVVLVAGLSNRGSVAETDISVEERLFRVNFFSYIALTKALLPHFLERKSGRFVIMSSVQGFFGLPMRAPYAASKHALHGYYESLRAEVAHENIDVNIVCPGYVKTELSLRALTVNAESENAKMDEATAKGFHPSYFAEKTIQGLTANKEYIVVAQTSANFAIFLKRFFPGLLSSILKRRGKKEMQKHQR